MKKTICQILFLSLLASLRLVQIIDIENSFEDVWDTIRIICPMILGTIFLVGFLVNTRHFFGRIQISSGYLRFQDWDYPTNIYLSYRDGNMLMKCHSVFSFLKNSVFQTKNNNRCSKIAKVHRSKLNSDGT